VAIIMEQLVHVLYLLSTGLLMPVIVLLLTGAATTLFSFGGFVGELLDRRLVTSRDNKHACQDVDMFKRQLVLDEKSGLARQLVARMDAQTTIDVEQLVTELELAAAARLARLQLGVRLGPLLGLMGTLIPLGPALLGLSEMKLEAITKNLVVAFTTTVVGLLIGGLCFAMLTLRRQWYARDLADIEYMASTLGSERKTHEAALVSSTANHAPASAATPSR
jgi:biopolymer transport protein ExbB/TolQ